MNIKHYPCLARIVNAVGRMAPTNGQIVEVIQPAPEEVRKYFRLSQAPEWEIKAWIPMPTYQFREESVCYPGELMYTYDRFLEPLPPEEIEAFEQEEIQVPVTT